VIVTFIKTEGDYFEAVIRVQNLELHVMDSFGREKMESGKEIKIELFPGLVDENEEWEDIFAENQSRKTELGLKLEKQL